MFKSIFALSLLSLSLSAFSYAIQQKDLGESKTRVQFTIECADGKQTTVHANANQLKLVEGIAADFCKNRGGIAKRDGIRSSHSVKPILNSRPIKASP